MIVAGIASIPSRINQLRQTILSLLPQVDKINLSLNNFTSIPDEFKNEHNYKLHPLLTQGTDEQKFRKVEGDIYLSCDDDLIYPSDYVEETKLLLKVYEGNIVTYHGRRFHTFPVNSYYKDKSSRYRCLDVVSDDIQVHVGGTGCMAFYTKDFFLTLEDFKYRYMADIQVAIKARQQGKKIMCCAHQSGWITYQQVENTIYEKFRDNDRLQTSLVNNYYGS